MGFSGLQLTGPRIIMWGFPYPKKKHQPVEAKNRGYQGGRANFKLPKPQPLRQVIGSIR